MPGPDGLSGTFYKQYLDVVSGGVVRAIQNFSATGRLPNNFVTLIPKVKKPSSSKEFRPISSCNCVTRLWQNYWLIV